MSETHVRSQLELSEWLYTLQVERCGLDTVVVIVLNHWLDATERC